MHDGSLNLDNLKNSLSDNSRLILEYLISNNHVEMLTPKMVVKILKKIYGISVSLNGSQIILLELSFDGVSILDEELSLFGEEISKADYIELHEDQKLLVSCYFYSSMKLKKLRKYAN